MSGLCLYPSNGLDRIAAVPLVALQPMEERVESITLEDVRQVVRDELARSRSPWLDSDGAAAYLGTSAGTLKTWRATGKGPKYHVIQDRLVRYHVDELDAFVRAS